ncbi:MAG: hypothetical protein OXU23_06810 [Candidatus Poribacteria bacterium]|nr:hypothetical protein [Candidatus Poribacteria bacterium]
MQPPLLWERPPGRDKEVAPTKKLKIGMILYQLEMVLETLQQELSGVASLYPTYNTANLVYSV